jgi:hypothetical protein
VNTHHVSVGALDDHLSFHFGKAGHDGEEEAPGRRVGVDGVGEATELDALRVPLSGYFEICDRTSVRFFPFSEIYPLRASEAIVNIYRPLFEPLR